MKIRTSKVKYRGTEPPSEYSYHITITDGKKTARFIPDDASSELKRKDLIEVENELGSRLQASDSYRFGSTSQNDIKDMFWFLQRWGTKKNAKVQIQDAHAFVNACLTIPIYFDESAEDTIFEYTY